MDKEFIGPQVRKYREKRGLAQEFLAEKVELSQIQISYIERGKRLPSLASLVRISDVLMVPVDILIHGENDANISVRMKILNTRIEELEPKKAAEVLELIETIVEVSEKYTKD